LKYTTLTPARLLTSKDIFLPSEPNLEHKFARFECFVCHSTPWVEICGHETRHEDCIAEKTIDYPVDWMCSWCEAERRSECKALGVAL
jgi:hypothetical protein